MFKQHIDIYRKAWTDAGHPGEAPVYLRCPGFVAKTDAAAQEAYGPTLMRHFQNQSRLLADSSRRQNSPPDRQHFPSDARARAWLQPVTLGISESEYAARFTSPTQTDWVMRCTPKKVLRTAEQEPVVLPRANTSPLSRGRAPARQAAGNQRPWPADKVERWAIDRLIPYAKNARTHTDAQVAAIAASVGEHVGALLRLAPARRDHHRDLGDAERGSASWSCGYRRIEPVGSRPSCSNATSARSAHWYDLPFHRAR